MTIQSDTILCWRNIVMTDKEASAIGLRVQRRRWFEYKLADEIFYYLERVYQQPRSDRMDNLLIYGETNSGKTQIVKHFIKTIKRNKTEGVRGRDILFIGAPDKATEGRLWDSVLK